MSQEPIEELLRAASDWEPTVEVRAGLAARAMQARRQRTGRSLALAGTAFAFGFGLMAVVNTRLPSSGPVRNGVQAAIATPSGGLEEPVAGGSAPLPAGVGITPAGKNGQTTKGVGALRLRPQPTPGPTPRPRRVPRPLRETRLAPHIRTANFSRTFVPIDEPTVLPGVIAQPSADGTEVRLIPAAVSPEDSDVIVTRTDTSEGTRH